MAAYSQWFNLENSINPFQFQSQSIGNYVRQNENSILSYPKNVFQSKQQQSRSQVNYLSLMDNILPKNEYPCNLIVDKAFHIINGQISKQKDQNLYTESSIQQDDLTSQMELQKKGLKNLSKLLIQTLKKKKIHSHKQLTEQVEDFLIKKRSLTKNETFKFSKNIRRRIYDALNVMISANVLGSDLQFTKKINVSNKKKPSLSISQIPQFQRKIQESERRVQDKKQFLKELYNKKRSIQKLINKNKSSQKQAQNFAQKNKYYVLKQIHYNQQNKQIQQNLIQNQQASINFPIILFCSSDDQFVDNLIFTGHDKVSIPYENGNIKIYSQLDLINNFGIGSQIDKNQLQLTSKSEKCQEDMVFFQENIQIDSYVEINSILQK